MNRFFSRWFPLLAYALAIFLVSSASVRENPLTQGFGSYVMHFLEFFILATLVLRVYYPARYCFSLAISVSFLFALSDEFHQLFVPGRTFSLFDLAADFLGSLFVIVFKDKLLAKFLLLG
jgi:VanZ family protein